MDWVAEARRRGWKYGEDIDALIETLRGETDGTNDIAVAREFVGGGGVAADPRDAEG
jgi:hypothetical protein